MRADLTDDPAAFRGRDWTDLAVADPDGTFFHTPAYLKVWWEELGAGRLVLAFLHDGERTVGACAFEVEEGELRFLGGFDVTDYMGPVGLPGVHERAAKELMATLASELEWERADLRGLPEGSAWLPALAAAAAGHGLRVDSVDDGVAPFLPLPATYPRYLAGLPSKLRHEITRKERRLRAELGDYRVRLASPGSLRADMDRFVDLHRASPGPKGRFMHAGMEIFFRRLGEAFLVPHVFHLAFLEVDGRKAAGAIGFAFKGTFSLYNSAFDREWSALSPGMVLVADMIAGAIEEGRETFDLLKGDLEYKYRFGATPRPVRGLLLRR
jgi:CelD/BcsL family acetyltransferase involved in cellulose biosynthesis